MASLVETTLFPLQEDFRANQEQMSSAQIKFTRLSLAGKSLGLTLADTCLGVFLTCKSMINKHENKELWHEAMEHVRRSKEIIAYPYTELLRICNDDAKFSRAYDRERDFIAVYLSGIMPEDPVISSKGDGLITHYAKSFLEGLAKYKFRDSDNLIQQHVFSRLTFALTAIACIITRVADGIIGVLAATLSLFTLGKFDVINNVAYRGLQFTGFIFDLCYYSTKIINPWAGH